MAHSINTSYAVIVLGDRETTERADLIDKAAAQGATIAESYGFEPGQAGANDNISEVDAVVTALSRAIATRTDVWAPFPFLDLGREQHVRRISLVLQRHGLNMLFGHDLEPCTTDGGFNPIDFAMRDEVRSVDELDYAAVSNAGIPTLFAEIERELNAQESAEPDAAVEPDDEFRPDAGAEKIYSTAQVAQLFGRSVQWVHAGMRKGLFTYRDGSMIEPMRIGKSKRCRFTLPMLKEMVCSCYRQGVIDVEALLDLLSVLTCEEADH